MEVDCVETQPDGAPMPAVRLASDAGMTLVELIFAAGVLATALSIVFGSLVSISLLGKLNETRAEGMLAVSSVMEEINTLPLSRLYTYVPPEVKAPGYYHQVDVEMILPGSSTANGDEGPTVVPLPLAEDYAGDLPNPVEVRVRVTWEDDQGRVYRVEQSTLRGE